MASPQPCHALFDTSFTLTRLSPLHNFPPLTPSALASHAKALLGRLRGDVLRGVRVADDPATDPRAGRLSAIVWTPLPPWTFRRNSDDDEEQTGNNNNGVHITITYENTTYTALLLRGKRAGGSSKSSTRLPLLLTRMTVALREALLEYLASSFDTLALPLTLSDALLREAMERYVGALQGEIGSRDCVLTFVPPAETSASPDLKTVTVTIDGNDVRRFWIRGEESDAKFFDSLGRYLLENAGMRVREARLVKVAVGGLVIGVGAGEQAGKLKMLEPRSRAEMGALEHVLAVVLRDAEEGLD